MRERSTTHTVTNAHSRSTPPQGNYTHIDGTYFIHKYLNSGNFLLKHNARTRRLMEMWRVGYEFQVRLPTCVL